MTFCEALQLSVTFLKFLSTSQPEVSDVFSGYRKGALTYGTFFGAFIRFFEVLQNGVKKLVPNFPQCRQTV